MAKAWVRKTPARFEFAVKVWQKFTHPKKIGEGAEGGESWEKPGEADADLFRKGIDPLLESGKLGVLLFQYPPGFHSTKQNVERLHWTLGVFKDFPKVVELRHRSWSDRARETKSLIDESGASWVLIDEPKFGASVKQELDPGGPIFYFRLHGRNRERWWTHGEPWERYDYFYSTQEIEGIAQRLKSMTRARSQDVRKAFVFFNNHARGQAVVNAIMLGHGLGVPVKARPIGELLRKFPQISELVPGPSGGTLF